MQDGGGIPARQGAGEKGAGEISPKAGSPGRGQKRSEFDSHGPAEPCAQPGAAAAWPRQGPREELTVRRLTEAAAYPTLVALMLPP